MTANRLTYQRIWKECTAAVGRDRVKTKLVYKQKGAEGLLFKQILTKIIGCVNFNPSVPFYSDEGECHDNAVAESFFGTLKTELIDHEDYYTRHQAKQSLFEYIEVFYNRQRRHSYLDYVSPVEYERANAL